MSLILDDDDDNRSASVDTLTRIHAILTFFFNLNRDIKVLIIVDNLKVIFYFKFSISFK